MNIQHSHSGNHSTSLLYSNTTPREIFTISIKYTFTQQNCYSPSITSINPINSKYYSDNLSALSPISESFSISHSNTISNKFTKKPLLHNHKTMHNNSSSMLPTNQIGL